jgi:hypothetical protein
LTTLQKEMASCNLYRLKRAQELSQANSRKRLSQKLTEEAGRLR